MKLITKTPQKVVLKYNLQDVNEYGFDFIWDKIRNRYSYKNYDIAYISEQNGDLIVCLSKKF